MSGRSSKLVLLCLVVALGTAFTNAKGLEREYVRDGRYNFLA